MHNFLAVFSGVSLDLEQSARQKLIVPALRFPLLPHPPSKPAHSRKLTRPDSPFPRLNAAPNRCCTSPVSWLYLLFLCLAGPALLRALVLLSPDPCSRCVSCLPYLTLCCQSDFSNTHLPTSPLLTTFQGRLIACKTQVTLPR